MSVKQIQSATPNPKLVLYIVDTICTATHNIMTSEGKLNCYYADFEFYEASYSV